MVLEFCGVTIIVLDHCAKAKVFGNYTVTFYKHTS